MIVSVLKRLFLPQLVMAAVVVCVFSTATDDGSLLQPCTAVIVAQITTIVCLTWSIVAVMGFAGPDSPPPRTTLSAEERRKKQDTAAACVLLLVFGLAGLEFSCAFVRGCDWQMLSGLHVAWTEAALLAALRGADALDAYRRNVWPRVQRRREERLRAATQEQRRAAVRAARRQVDRFYRPNQALLQEVMPEAVYRSHLYASIPDDAEPSRAWQAARDLIETLRPLVAKALQGRRQEEERRRRTRDDIGALQARIDALAGRTDDEALEEMVELQRRMARLQGRQLRRTVAPDDL